MKITLARSRPRCHFCRTSFGVLRWEDADLRNSAIWACLRHTRRALRYLRSRDASQNFHSCVAGQHRHCGRDGAAGILPVTSHRGSTYVLLNRRTARMQQGGTWSTFGGSIERSDPGTWAAAVRETLEECDGLHLPGTAPAAHTARCPHGCGWTYTTYTARVPMSRVRVRDFGESTAVRWVRVQDVASMNLHPAFRAAWPALQRQFGATPGRSEQS
jgi:8-oxo-dGTP pyrophosphatase MutT (NUDIX family)